MASSTSPKVKAGEDPVPEGRLQYSLGTLMLLITASAVFLGMCQGCGVGMRPAVFAIGFCVFMMVVCGLMRSRRTDWIEVRETASPAEAMLYRNELRAHGIAAEVLGEFNAFPGVFGRPPRIVVRPEDADEARKLLARQSPPVDD